MKYKIDFDIPQHPLPQHWPKFLLMGSCFAANQASRLQEKGFDTTGNPFGILYNPVSIASLLFRIKENRLYTKDDFVHHNMYFSLEHHGKLKYDSLQEAIETSNRIMETYRKKLMESDVVVITYGTSLVYHNTVHKKIVANCHKLPARDFELIQLQAVTVKNTIANTIRDIRELNPKAHILFTVSPVRHLRSGVVESSRSKACLLTAIHESLPDLDHVSYFPAYEIVIDELRDYRFTKEDLMHPTEQAQEYVLEQFLSTYLNNESKLILKEIEKFSRFAQHKPIGSADLHRSQVAERRRELEAKYPFISIQ